MAVAVISMITAMALFGMTSFMDGSKESVTRKNAQSFAQMVAAARAVGIEFKLNTKEGILAELVQGIQGKGAFADITFRLNLGDGERAGVLRVCTLDATGHIRIDA